MRRSNAPVTPETVAGISSDAVKAKTGKTWPQWLSTLDAAGARNKSHKEIVAILRHEHGLDPWWRQMVTVGFEQARGLRRKHEKPGGFEIGVSKTVRVPVDELYSAVKDARRRRKWLTLPEAAPEKLVIRKATQHKSMRIGWVDGKTNLNVNFWDKGPAKAQVVVQHTKLKSAAAAEKAKAYWREQLAALKATMET